MFEPLAAADSIISPIEQAGNYFIMDSEQLVSKPFEEMQTVAIDSVKKNSLTEKLTTVKNNIEDYTLRTEKAHLERSKNHKLRTLHEKSSKLRYEVKLMDIYKRKNELEIQKRIEPKKDVKYDENQILSTERRLGLLTQESYYLDKKLQHPLRERTKTDIHAKKIVKDARKTMLKHKIEQKHLEKKQEMERAQTAITMSSTTIGLTSMQSSRQDLAWQRRGSKSAPPNTNFVDSIQQSPYHQDEVDNVKLPSIDEGPMGRHKQSHVKFSMTESRPMRQSTPDGLFRSKTYYSGMTRKSHGSVWDTAESEINYGSSHRSSENIDLRTLLFGNKAETDTRSNLTSPRTFTTGTRQSSGVPSLRKGHGGQPVITQESLKKENREIREKIDKFMGNLYPRNDDDSESSEDEHEVEEAKIQAQKTNFEEEVKLRASQLLQVFSKPVDPYMSWGYVPPHEAELERLRKERDLKRSQSVMSDRKADQKTEAEKKNLWEYIRGRVNNGDIRKLYTPNDLILQQITGLMVGGGKKTAVPLHSASRALRHTPTFKMRKVVEDLMKQRTKFEQQEVETLKKMYEEGADFEQLEAEQERMNAQKQAQQAGYPPNYPPRAWGTPTRQLEQEV